MQHNFLRNEEATEMSFYRRMLRIPSYVRILMSKFKERESKKDIYTYNQKETAEI